MKHTLKTLLATKVLALPAAFGSANIDESAIAASDQSNILLSEERRLIDLGRPEAAANVETAETIAKLIPLISAGPKLSFVELFEREHRLTQMGKHDEAARVYLDSLSHLCTVWFDVLCAAGKIEELGYPDLAIQAYEISKNLPNTQIYSDIAKTHIARLKQLIATSPTSTLDRLLIVIRRVAGGTIKLDGSPKNFEVGFLDAKDVSNLSLASSVFYKLAEPILALAKAWRQTTDVIPRLLLPARIIPFDQEKLRFLRVNTDASFDNLLDIAFDVKFWTVPMSYENHAAYVRVINGNARFGDTEKRILRGLLPNATEGDAREAAYALKVLGMTPVGHEVRTKYHDKAAVLYERSADTQGATSRDVQRAGDSLRALGDLWPDNPDQRTKYHVIATAVYERIASRPGARLHEIQMAADRLRKLGNSCQTTLNNVLDIMAKQMPCLVVGR